MPRPAVLRKQSFGSRGAAGGTWLGRMMSVCTMLRKRGQDVMGYLVEARNAFRADRPVPLIPGPHLNGYPFSSVTRAATKEGRKLMASEAAKPARMRRRRCPWRWRG